MWDYRYVLALVAGLIAAPSALATMHDVRVDPTDACPTGDYVVYPEASGVVYADGFCSFDVVYD
jgi:hypothetical protein